MMVLLPLVTADDRQDRTAGKTPKGQTTAHARERDKKRLAQIVQAAAAQGGLLTLPEVRGLLNKSYEVVRSYAAEWQAETGETLPLKGYQMDQCSRPTHKGAIVRLYEQGKEPPNIAYETGHALKSGERYLQDYERVKLLLKRGVAVSEISATIGRGERIVLEYVEIAREYHPELFEAAD